MTTLEIILLCVCATLAIVFIVARTLKGGLGAFILKTVASFGFVTSGILGIVTSCHLCSTTKLALGLIVIGLLLGMIGDMVLDLKVVYPDSDKYYLNTGMTSFFLGHACYVVAFSMLSGLDTLLVPVLIALGVAIVLTTLTIAPAKKIGLNFGKYLIQATTYSLILTFAMAYSLILAINGAGLWLTFIGLALFFLSDIVLSFQYFGGKIANKPMIAINHALYYAAQIILVAVLFVI